MSDNWAPDIDSDENAVEDQDFKEYKDALLFAIEVSPSMLEPIPETGKSTVLTVLEIAYESIADRIIYSPIDASGIFLYGTKKSEMENSNKKYELFSTSVLPLGLPDADSLKNLKDLIEDAEEFQRVGTPSEEQVSMADVFYYANQEFMTRSPRHYSRRLFLITDNDNPHEDPVLRKAAKTRALDLTQLGVRITPYLLSTPSKPGQKNPLLFYDEIMLAPPTLGSKLVSTSDIIEDIGEASDIKIQTIEDLTAFRTNVKSRQMLRRSTFSNTIELSPELKIGVKGYNLFIKKYVTKSEWVFTQSERPVLAKISSKYLGEQSGKELEPTEIRRTYQFGEMYIPFLPEQIKEIRHIDDPIIRIIGFKPMSLLKDWQNMNHSVFIYPSDSKLKGSIRAFTSLYQTLLKKDKFAVVWSVLRANTSPVVQAMIPVPEFIDDDHNLEVPNPTSPPGFHLMTLPFADNIRTFPTTLFNRASNDLVDQMKKILSQLRMPKAYQPERYPNLQLEYFYKVLQALALDEPVPELTPDKTKPKYNSINNRAGDLIEHWNQLLSKEYHLHDRDEQQVEDGSAASGVGAEKRKKAKLPDQTDKDWEDAYDKDLISRYTVAQLKSFMESHGIKKGQNQQKAALVAAVNQYFKKQLGY